MTEIAGKTRVFIVTDFGKIEITYDPQIMRNLNWSDSRLQVERKHAARVRTFWSEIGSIS